MNLARLFHEDHEIAASSSQLISGSPYAMELLQRFKAGRSFSGLSVADVFVFGGWQYLILRLVCRVVFGLCTSTVLQVCLRL